MNRWIVGLTAVAFLSAPAIMAASTRTSAKVVQTTESSQISSSTSGLNRYALGWLDTNKTAASVTAESKDRRSRTMDENAIAWSNSGKEAEAASDAAAGDEQFATLVSLTSAASLSDQLNQKQLEYLQSDAGRDDLIALLKARPIDGPPAGNPLPETEHAGLY
ncbi:MAG: hypothetical protein AAFW65_06610 [Pseudomonadota bacterium]